MNWSALPLIWNSIIHAVDVSLFSVCVVVGVGVLVWAVTRVGRWVG